MVRFDNLRYIEHKDCWSIDGNCLLNMKINQLRHLNLMGSYRLAPEVIIHLLSGHYQSLELLICFSFALMAWFYSQDSGFRSIGTAASFGSVIHPG